MSTDLSGLKSEKGFAWRQSKSKVIVEAEAKAQTETETKISTTTDGISENIDPSTATLNPGIPKDPTVTFSGTPVTNVSSLFPVRPLPLQRLPHTPKQLSPSNQWLVFPMYFTMVKLESWFHILTHLNT